MNLPPNSPDPAPGTNQAELFGIDALIGPDLSGCVPNASSSGLLRINATGIADATIGVLEHASIVLGRDRDGLRVLESGTQEQIDCCDLPKSTPVLTLNDSLIVPAMVNAHTHLDLTHIGPVSHEPGDGFVPWVDMIRASRALEPHDIAQSTMQGISLSLRGGVIAVGDIAGAPRGQLTSIPALTLAKSPLIGVSFLEFFGIGKTAATTTGMLDSYLRKEYVELESSLQGTGVTLGLQPHAPNTVDLSLYRWAIQAAMARSMPVSTHLAETPEERQFISKGTGPQRELLERFGIWDQSVLDHLGKGKHPIEHLRPVLESMPVLVAHVNDADDAGIDLLARTGTSVAYCPRASSYFAAEQHFGPHRYREMLDAGVNVCLGTDSIVNLDTPDRISVLDDMRLLWAKGHTNPKQLLAMASVNGAEALGLDPNGFGLTRGQRPRGLLRLPLGSGGAEVFARAMRSSEAPQWIILQNS